MTRLIKVVFWYSPKEETIAASVYEGSYLQDLSLVAAGDYARIVRGAGHGGAWGWSCMVRLFQVWVGCWRLQTQQYCMIRSHNGSARRLSRCGCIGSLVQVSLLLWGHRWSIQ